MMEFQSVVEDKINPYRNIFLFVDFDLTLKYPLSVKNYLDYKNDNYIENRIF